LKHPLLWLIAVAAFIALALLALPFPYIVLGAGFIGVLGGRLAPTLFNHSSHSQPKATLEGRAVIDDDTASPAHAQFRWRRAAAYAVIALASWMMVLSTLIAVFGWQHTLPQMGWFFSKAALVTFGGAYAVLPYVQQAAVEQYGWLTTPQMIDGLALGETTPGPLIMIVAFVGFLGGWNQMALGAESLAAAGIVGACIATFFTFLPSFVFILVGGPLVEATRNDAKFTAPLTAISAAVTGVILNLAVYFAYHVFWPSGTASPMNAEHLWQTLDLAAVAIAAASLVALIRLKIGVIPVILGCGVIGLIRVIL
jgi:chromate transporter